VGFGTTACYTDLLVAPKLAQECRLEMDISSTCPLTSEAIDTLKNSLNVSNSNNSKKSSQQYDEICLTISKHNNVQTLSYIREEGDELGSNQPSTNPPMNITGLDKPPELIEDSEYFLPPDAVKITKIDRNELVNSGPGILGKHPRESDRFSSLIPCFDKTRVFLKKPTRVPIENPEKSLIN
jgi:hypothetical protein